MLKALVLCHRSNFGWHVPEVLRRAWEQQATATPFGVPQGVPPNPSSNKRECASAIPVGRALLAPLVADTIPAAPLRISESARHARLRPAGGHSCFPVSNPPAKLE